MHGKTARAILLTICVGPWLALGCKGEEPVEPPTISLDEYETYGHAPWDPVLIELDMPDTGYPELADEGSVSLVDEEGTLVPMELLEECGEHWSARGGLPEGSYDSLVVTSPDGQEDVTITLPKVHEVRPFGRDPAFDVAELEGTAFLLDSSSLHGCGLTDVAGAYLPGPIWIELVELEDGEATFRLVQEWEEDQACVYLEDVASISATGEFGWEADGLTLATEPELDAYDLVMRLGFDASAEKVAGLELSGLLDFQDFPLEQITPVDTLQDFCNLTTSFGTPCQTCPGGELETCIHFHWFAAKAGRNELPYDATSLEDCQVMIEAELPSCEIGCAAAPGRQVPGILLGALGLALWRRRRSDDTREG